jgi:hypothetical protein
MRMSKQICRCTLIAGMVLVLAAVVILLHGGITRGSGPSQRVRVELALTHLEACESCHMARDTAFVVVDVEPVHHTIVFETAAPALTATQSDDDPVRAQLIDLGHRLLGLPAAGDAYVDAAADAFLAAYQAYQTDSAVDMPGLLAAAAQQVIEAEHHAHPVQVRAMTMRVSPDATDAVSGTPPATWAMSNSRVIVILPGLDSVPVRENTAVSRPVGVVLGIQRRGPPAAGFDLC